ncbi:AAA family ATPase [bacterium]|nr:AAA family ATPase [bacterium]
MYKEFFGLKDNPFDLTPDSHFLFPSKKHQEALAHLTYGIEARKGFIMITGEVGAGKTTLCRALLSRVNPNVEVAFVLNSYLNAFEILQAINQDLGIPTKAQSKKELVDELNEFLLRQKEQNRNVVVLIDECQNLPFETLEQLRMLSNLETEKEKLLQIIMVGQPELLDILNRQELRQLNQRITVRYHLYPLDYKETVEYIYHRLKIAGSDGSVHFSDKSLKKIFSFSKGVPRIINVVCDNTLLAAYVSETKKIHYKLVKKAIKEIQGKKPLKDLESSFFSLKFSFRRVFKLVTAGAFVLLAVLVFSYYNEIKDHIDLFSNTIINNRKIYEQAIERLIEEKKQIKTVFVNDWNSAAIPAAVAPVPIKEIKPDNASMGAVLDLLAMWKVNPALIQSIRKKYIHKDQLDYEKIALSAGLSYVVSWADLDTLIKYNIPVLLEISDPKDIRKYVLLKSVSPDGLNIVEGVKEKKVAKSDLEDIFVGNAVYFIKGVINADDIYYFSSSGKTVKNIQAVLRDLGVYKGVISGSYDDKVVEAVKKFQQQSGLNPDGIVDINTRIAMIGAQKKSNVPYLK